MSRCARCGLPEASVSCGLENTCQAVSASKVDSNHFGFYIIACRDRQIANQASLLRSVTIKLEKAHQLCADDYPKSAAGLIEQVLEVLS